MSRFDGAGPAIERLLDDQAIHEYLSTAAANVRGAAGRVRGKGTDAVADEKLYTQIGTTISALWAAGARALGRPEPEPQRVGGAGSVLLLGLGTALLVEGLRARA